MTQPTCETCSVARWLACAVEYAARFGIQFSAPTQIISPCQCVNIRDEQRRRSEFMKKHQSAQPKAPEPKP